MPTLRTDSAPRPKVWANSRRAALALALVLIAVSLAPRPAQALAADDFSVFSFDAVCGMPVSQQPPDRRKPGVASILQRGWVDRFSMRVYHGAHTASRVLGNGPLDPDVMQQGCVPQSRLEKIERYARQIFARMHQFGFRRHANAPIVLRDPSAAADDSESGKLTQRIYVRGDGYGNILSPCRPDGRLDKDRVSHVEIGVETARSAPDHRLYFFIAHELSHAMQYGADLVRGPGTDDCANIHSWLANGQANEIARYLTRAKFPKATEGLTGDFADGFYGLRHYTISLSQLDRSERERPFPGYGASSFWRHLFEHYAKGDRSALRHIVSQDDPVDRRDDWLRWARTVIDGGTPFGAKVKDPLYLIFPHFLADYAQWGERRFPWYGRDKWRDVAFDGGCRVVRLNPDAPTQEIGIKPRPLTGTCVHVVVHELDGYGAVGINTLAKHDDRKDFVDALHLSAIQLRGQGETDDCFTVTRKSRGAATCLMKPFFLEVSEKAQSVAGGQYAKSWLSVPQAPGGSGSPAMAMLKEVDRLDPRHCPCVVNSYVVSYTPPEASDDDVSDGWKRRMEIPVAFSLDAAKVKHGGSGTGPSGSSGGAAVGSVGSARHIGLASASPGGTLSTLPDRSSELGRGQGAAFSSRIVGMDIDVPPLSENRDRLTSVNFTTVKVSQSTSGGAPVELEDKLSLFLRIPKAGAGPDYGDTDTYKAYVTGGTGGGRIALNWPPDEPSGRIAVRTYGADTLRVVAKGSYCFLRDIVAQQGDHGRCRRIRRFQAEMIKPFGWMHDPNYMPSNLDDTPGMKLYRGWLERQMTGIGLPTGPGGPGGPGALGGDDGGNGGTQSDSERLNTGANVSSACTCTCEAYKALKSKAEKLKRKAKKDPMSALEDGMGSISKLTKCSMQCRRAWADCEEP